MEFSLAELADILNALYEFEDNFNSQGQDDDDFADRIDAIKTRLLNELKKKT